MTGSEPSDKNGVLLGLDVGVEFLDTAEVFVPCLFSVHTGVDVHCLCFGVSTDVFEYVIAHSLVPHQGGEHGSKRVWSELFVESCLPLLHNS